MLREYVAYFNTARPHQGIGQAIPDPAELAPPTRSAAPIVALPVLNQSSNGNYMGDAADHVGFTWALV